ncbi:MAG: pyridoxal-phosphate dependent enzyme [Salinirussus sp.]
MELHTAVSGYECLTCGASLTANTDPRECPECGGPLELAMDLDAIQSDLAGADDRSGLSGLLGISTPVDLCQGETPLIDAPGLAREIGVESLAIKDEAQNPTGSLVDRQAACAVAAAREAGAGQISLPTTGAAGVAVTMAAARIDLDTHVFVPSRASFGHKAMINVHGGDMTVVEGRYSDAAAAYDEHDTEAYPLAPFATPFRRAGVTPIAIEIAAARDWTAPDAVVIPAGQVCSIVGIHRGFTALDALDMIDGYPRIIAAQAASCAPLTDDGSSSADRPHAIEHPDTVVGALEVPDPAGGTVAIDVLRESGGTAIAIPDEAILEAALTLAERGLPTSATGGAGLAALQSDSGVVEEGADVVLVNPIAGASEADILRSHLMRRPR